MDRFYCPVLEEGQLSEAESRHCLQVLRAKVGDSLVVFNGLGKQWTAEITGVAGRRVRFTKREELETAPAKIRIFLVQAIPKAKAMDVILQKATELGIAGIIPVVSERTVARVEGAEALDKAEKWRDGLIEAAKQSGQNWLPSLTPPQSLRSFLSSVRPNAIQLFGSLHPGAQPMKSILRKDWSREARPRDVYFLIGPEGDLSPSEARTAQEAGFQPVTLGPLVLRSDTAALYVLSILRYELGDGLEPGS